MRQIDSYLKKQGYKILQNSVHDKNQTRFYHSIVEKDGTRYFCKTNKSSNALDDHINSETTGYFRKPPTKVRFIKPVITDAYKDHIIHCFPFIDQLPISNESKSFKDFSVKEADLDVFFSRVIVAIQFVAKQQIVTAKEFVIERSPKQEIFALVNSLPTNTPYGLELLKLIAKEGEVLTQRELSVRDIQPQNMFWIEDKQELYLFDLEAISPRPKYHDYAHFAVNLWCVCDRAEYAKRFLETVFADSPTEEKSEKYRYIRYNLAEILLEAYVFHKDETTREHIKSMMQWFRRDFLHFVNEIDR